MVLRNYSICGSRAYLPCCIRAIFAINVIITVHLFFNLMRQYTLILGIFLIANGLSGQITITSAHMPRSNDTLRYSEAAITSQIDYRKSGAAQTWDFSGLTPVSQGLYQYKPALQVSPVYFFWGVTTFGLKLFDSIGFGTIMVRDIYDFYKNSSSKFTAEGRGLTFSGFPIPSDYSDPDEIYQFPLEYNDRDSSTFNVRFQLSTIFTLVQQGYRINEVIGYGTVKTPYGDFNCLQVKTRIVQVDTLITSFGKIPIPRTTVQYKFLSTTERMPVLEVSGTELAGNFTPQFIRYRDKYLGIQSPLRPNARFSVNRTTGHVSDTFNFTDQSTNTPTGWNWSFTPANNVRFVGGTNAGSRNPRVVFDDKGTWTVKLIASNFFGSDDTLRNNLINIAWGTGTAHPEPVEPALYPIPAADFIILHPRSGAVISGAVKVYDFSGRDVSTLVIQKGQELDISALAPGKYWIWLNYGTPHYMDRQIFIKQ